MSPIANKWNEGKVIPPRVKRSDPQNRFGDFSPAARRPKANRETIPAGPTTFEAWYTVSVIKCHYRFCDGQKPNGKVAMHFGAWFHRHVAGSRMLPFLSNSGRFKALTLFLQDRMPSRAWGMGLNAVGASNGESVEPLTYHCGGHGVREALNC